MVYTFYDVPLSLNTYLILGPLIRLHLFSKEQLIFCILCYISKYMLLTP